MVSEIDGFCNEFCGTGGARNRWVESRSPLDLAVILIPNQETQKAPAI